MAIRIFEINESEWWAGDCTADELLAAYMQINGFTHEEAMGDSVTLPRELSEKELLSHIYLAESVSDNLALPLTFKDKLAQYKGRSGKAPFRFATLQW